MHRTTGMSAEFDDLRADYEGAKRTSRFQRRRRGVPSMGAAGDYHYRSEADFLWMAEVARDMYRNDPVLGQLTDRAVTNWVGSGLTPDPDTGDKDLDRDLKARWAEESLDPDTCDVAGELTFHEQELMVGREMLVPGDVFALPVQNGTVQLVESHRCRSPHRTQKNMVHGVELARETRKRLRYYFTREPIDPLQPASQVKLADLRTVAARDDTGEALVWHVYSPKRATQTRGVTAYAPIITTAGMFDDLNFATLLKAQLSAFWLLVRKRDQAFFDSNPNIQQLGVSSDAFTGSRRVEELAPGSEIGGNAGETITPWSPNIPNPEYFPHAKLILTLIGINLGMPLCLLLLDASETNFSGFRGAVDQARMGFRHNQRLLMARFHRPYWRFKLHVWADGDPVLAAARERLGEKYLCHKWRVPGWPYLEPTKDATADLLRAANMQTSLRRLAAERGMEWPEIVAEMVEDRTLAIQSALVAAKKLNTDNMLSGGDVVSWRDICPLPTPERVTVALRGDEQRVESEEPRARN